MSKYTAVVVLGLALTGCSSHSSGGGSTGGGITFQGQASPLSGFSYDTGLEPPTPPAQAELKLSAAGNIKVSADGSVQGGMLVGTAGSGNVALDVKFQLDGHLTVNAGIVSYDGNIPGLSNIDIEATGNSAFDPFLIGGPPASVTAPIPPTQLPPVPLGSVPGSLELAITSGSVLTTSFQGTCLTVKSGMATYEGTASTSGTLLLTATLALDAPISQSVPLPPITVNIPATPVQISLGTQPAPGASDTQQGTCTASGAPDGGASDGNTGPPPNDGGADTGMPSDGGTDVSPPFSATAVVNGDTLTPTTVMAYADPSNCGPTGYSVFLYFTGPGLGANTRFAMCLTDVGSGCSMYDAIEYQPDDGSSDTYFDDGTSTCGLDIGSLPPANISASFSGTLADNNMQSITVSLTFSTPLTQ